LPINLDNEISDRQDEWRYQNTITRKWYDWRTMHKNQNTDTKWRVKWLNIVPTSSLGVIVYLTRRHEVDSLNASLAQLSLLLSNNPRPVVIFHEGDFSDNDIQKSLARTLGSRTPLAFERIQFTKSANRSRSIYHGYSVSYCDMCRFFILMLPNHPLLTLFTFYWRLDAHSYIFGSKPIQDPFEIMQKRQIQYAFVMNNLEDKRFSPGLWLFFHKFLDQHCVEPSLTVRQTQTGRFGEYSLAIFFTNFAIANVSLFRDHPLIRAWLHTVDRDGGIYRYRWGDAPVHTLALTQFLKRDQIVCLRYFGYMHRNDYVCASELKQNVCIEQVRRVLRNPNMHYRNYPDACWPTPRNPFCHYFPEIRL
jgi:hypothetical protein